MEERRSVPSEVLALRAELQGKKTKKVGSVPFGGRCAVLRLAGNSLWAIIEGPNGSGIALRCAWAPAARLELLSVEGGCVELGSCIGTYRVEVSAPCNDAILRVTTTLTPSADVLVPWWPRDLYPLGENADPEAAKGEVMAAQKGFCTALIYARLDQPGEGSFLYLQDLTSLNDYFNATGAKPDGVVGGEWPELGYQGQGAKKAIPGGKEFVVSDAYLRLDPTPVDDPRVEASVFIEHQAALYPFLRKEPPEFHDWPSKAEATLRDLAESPLVTITDGGYRYVRPYVDAEYPDSMVQLAVLRTLKDYSDWRGDEPSLAEELRAGVYRFFDPRTGAVHRYLNTVGPDKEKTVVDSWYLYHPLTSLARLAKVGDEGAKDLFIAALPYAIKVAKIFHYSWPIQFDLESLMITTASREPGSAVGQTDAGGLYAYVMMDGYEITGDETYLEEAQTALRATADLKFTLVYQANLTSWGAVACLRVWKATEDRFYLDQASVFLAGFFHNCAMWESEIGIAKEPRTFLGVSCLHNGPYLAPYECYESFLSFHEALSIAGEDLSDAHKLLIAEFMRYALDRGWWFYPSSLKETSIAHEPRNGENVRSLAFPLEDLYVNGDPAGQVGQEVYGAGSAFTYATKAFYPLEGGRLLYCEYPLKGFEASVTGAHFSVIGPEGGACRARLLRPDGAKVTVGGKKVESEEFEVLVGAKVALRWTSQESRSSRAA